MARQPQAAATRLEIVRARRMPSSRPLITVPTNFPRSRSGARCTPNATRIWATTEVVPTRTDAARNIPKYGDSPAATSAAAVTSRVREASARFSSRSPSGRRSTSPSA